MSRDLNVHSPDGASDDDDGGGDGDDLQTFKCFNASHKC